MKNFKKMLSPLSVKDFFKNFWRKQPLHLVKETDLNKILKLEEINAYFGGNAIVYPFVRLIGNGCEIDKENYSIDPGGKFNLLDKGAAFKLFEEGNTIAIQAAQCQFKNLNKYVHTMEKELGMAVNANVYITPSNSKGFSPHLDTHEVLVLQVLGSKMWNIYDLPIAAPIKGMELGPEQREFYLKEKPVHNIKVEQGDLLYIPRGVVHDAYCEGEMSIHITFGLSPLLRLDVAKSLIKALERKAFFREPFFTMDHLGLTSEKTHFKHELLSVLDEVLEKDFSYDEHENKFRETADFFWMYYLIDHIERYKDDVEFQPYRKEDWDVSSLTAEEQKLLDLSLNGGIPEMITSIKEAGIEDLKRSLKSLIRRNFLQVVS